VLDEQARRLLSRGLQRGEHVHNLGGVQGPATARRDHPPRTLVERLERLQQDLHETFKDAVRERRGTKLAKDTPELFEGEVFTGRRAVELGLVDGLGDLRGVMRARFGEDVRLRVVAPARSRWRWWAPGTRAHRLDLGEIVGEIWGAIEERLHWGRFGL